MRAIRNSSLRLDRIPNPDGRINKWIKFAHTINGYAAAEDFAAPYFSCLEPTDIRALTALTVRSFIPCCARFAPRCRPESLIEDSR